MAGRIKGIKIEIEGETKGLDKALQDVNKRSRDLQSELRKVERALKFNPGSAELAAQKQELLAQQVEATSEKLQQLKEAEAEVERQFQEGEIGEEQYRAFKREIIETESKLNHYRSQLKKTETRMQKFGKSLQKAGKKMKTFGTNMQKAGKTLMKRVTAPVVGAISAVVAFTKKAGDMAISLKNNADSAGVSVERWQELNYVLGDYNLTQEDTERTLGRLNNRMGKAANGNQKYLDALEKVGITQKDLEEGVYSTDEAFLKSIESLSKIQNEHERAAATTELYGERLGRKLLPIVNDGVDGIESLREEFEELGIQLSEEEVADLEEFSKAMGAMGDAIKAVGAKVAADLAPVLQDTLIPMMKERLIPTLSELGEKIGDIIEWFADLSPQVQKLIGVLVGLAVGLGPVLFILGPITNALGNLTSGLGKILPLLGSFSGVLRVLFSPMGLILGAIIALAAGFAFLFMKGEELEGGLDGIVQKIGGMAGKIVEQLPALIEAGAKILVSIIQGIIEQLPMLVEMAVNIILMLARTLIEALPQIINAGINILLALIDGIIMVLPSLIQAAITLIISLVNALIANLPQIIEAGIKILLALIDGIISLLPRLIAAAVRLIVAIVGGLISNSDKILQAGIDLIWALIKGLGKMAVELGKAALELGKKIIGEFSGIDLFQIGKDIISGLIDGIKEVGSDIWGVVTDIANDIKEGFKSFFGIRSPSRLMRDDIGKQLGAGLVEGMKDSMSLINRASEMMGQAAVPNVASVSGGTTVTNNFHGLLDGAVFNVREDADIKRIARELGEYIEGRSRG